MLTAFLIFLATLTLVIWQPRGLGIGWSAVIGAGVALLAGVIHWGDIPVVWHIVWNATGTFIAVIIIIVTGLTLAFGDTSGGFRRLIQIVFGLSIAFAASSFFLSFFSFGGGALV